MDASIESIGHLRKIVIVIVILDDGMSDVVTFIVELYEIRVDKLRDHQLNKK